MSECASVYVMPAYINEAWNYALTATSADGGAVTFYLVSQDGDTTMQIVDGNLQLTWETAGTKPLIIRAVDSNGAWVEQHFAIQVLEPVVIINEPLVIRSVPTEQTRLGNTYQYRIVATDPNGDTLTYRLTNAPTGASLSRDGLLAWNPTVIGEYDFVIVVSDGEHETLQFPRLKIATHLPRIAESFRLVVCAVLPCTLSCIGKSFHMRRKSLKNFHSTYCTKSFS